MWLIMRGAMTTRIRRLHRTYYLPSMTAIATAIYENDGDYPPDTPLRDQLAGRNVSLEHILTRWSEAPRPTGSTASCMT